MKRKISKPLYLILFVFLLVGCGGGSEGEGTESSESAANQPRLGGSEADPMENKGIGPIKSLVLDANIDQAMAAEGLELYNQYCTACHKPEERFIGPAPKGILERRSPEWVMNMILNPEEMVKEDPIAKKLYMEYNMSPMANQGLTEDQARKILEYFRTL